MRLRCRAAAAEDLYSITRHIRKDNPTAAREVEKTIYDGCARLEKFPYRGRKGRAERTREPMFPGLPYIVIYRIKEDTVELARIYHGAQER